MSTQAYTLNGVIYIPENHLYHIANGRRALAVCGSAHTLAVMNQQGFCIGWILKEDLIRCQAKLCNPRKQ